VTTVDPTFTGREPPAKVVHPAAPEARARGGRLLVRRPRRRPALRRLPLRDERGQDLPAGRAGRERRRLGVEPARRRARARARPDIQWVAGPEPRDGHRCRAAGSAQQLQACYIRRAAPAVSSKKGGSRRRRGQLAGRWLPNAFTLGEGGVCRLPRPNGACYLEGRNGMR
jgi:hypothetical protein